MPDNRLETRNKQTRKPRRFMRVLFPCLAAATVLFIFLNSSRSGAASGETSRQVTTWLAGQPGLGSMAFLTENLVRKAGHIGEYALLGIFLLLSLRAYTKKPLRYLAWPLLAGVLVALADECYQLTVPDRNGQLTDVWVDLAGLLLGFCLCAGVLCIIRAVKKRREKKYTTLPEKEKEAQ